MSDAEYSTQPEALLDSESNLSILDVVKSPDLQTGLILLGCLPAPKEFES